MSSSPVPVPEPPSPPQSQSQSPAPSTLDDSPPSAPPKYVCQWTVCTLSFQDPEELYNHLCNDHIGRKSTGNLCLTCKWNECGTTCAKRDHITSHLRVHTPLKPHVCDICQKTFKRPQDLKKHAKIHTEEHHAQHKHSKAITVPDPSISTRAHRPSVPSGRPSPGHIDSRNELQVPAYERSKSQSSASDTSTFGILPTPSPELGHHRHAHEADIFHDHDNRNTIPSWQVFDDGAVSVGMKRPHSNDYSVDDFFADMKKRRVNPSYDSHMVERLNNIVYGQHHNPRVDNHYNQPSYTPPNHNASNTNFNPRSISFDIRTPEELAAVNDFLLTLGRNVQRSSNGAGGYNTPPDSYFDPLTLGLAGMPGIPSSISNASSTASSADFDAFTTNSPPTHTPGYVPFQSRPQYSTTGGSGGGAMYPNISSVDPPGYATNSPAVASPRRIHLQAAHQPPPQTHSRTPPGILLSPVNGSEPFDYLRPARSSVSATLAPADFSTKGMRREAMRLKSLPGRPASPAPSSAATYQDDDDRMDISSSRNPTPAPAPTPSGSLYPLLTTEGNAKYKLPPLNVPPSPTSSTTSSLPSVPSSQNLPSLRSTLRSVAEAEDSTSEGEEDERLRLRMKEMRLRLSSTPSHPQDPREKEREQRRRHVEFIRGLLISINEEYKKSMLRSDNLSAAPVDRSVDQPDIEMAAA